MTPFEAWHQRKPSVQHIRVFGTKAFVLNTSRQRGKLSPRSRVCIFVGFSPGVKGYKLYDPSRRQFVTSRDVVFTEDKYNERLIYISTFTDTHQSAASTEGTLPEPTTTPAQEPITTESSRELGPLSTAPLDSSSEQTNQPVQRQVPERIQQVEQRQITTRSGRAVQLPKRYAHVADREVAPLTMVDDMPTHSDPRTVAEAKASNEWLSWYEAMENEMNSIAKNKTFRMGLQDKV